VRVALDFQSHESGLPTALLNDGSIQMDHNFFSLLLWNLAGICLVLVLRRHRLRLRAGFAW
jgi:hypothetical protein